MIKRLWWKIVLGVLAAVVLFAVGFVIYLTVTEYSPKARQTAEHVHIADGKRVQTGKQMTVYTWNIGYGGLGAEADFFMDGGSNVNPEKAEVERNLEAVKTFISSQSADAWLLQEVDTDSARTANINELEALSNGFDGSFGLAYNYKCDFVPFPWPPIGKIESGIATLTGGSVNGTFERISLPCPFSWPVSVANLKRCLLVTRLEVEGSDKEVVLVNLHLEAYDDGEGKIAQTKILMDFLQSEFEKGNYVIAGGDFNQVFPGTLETYPVGEGVWTPGNLADDDLPEGFRYAFDGDSATCRLLDKPLSINTQKYIIDGFIVSPNVRIDTVETVELGFENSDHNPVKLEFTLMQ